MAIPDELPNGSGLVGASLCSNAIKQRRRGDNHVLHPPGLDGSGGRGGNLKRQFSTSGPA